MSKNQGYHDNKYKYNYFFSGWDDGIGNYFWLVNIFLNINIYLDLIFHLPKLCDLRT